jgi:hypothetical protein
MMRLFSSLMVTIPLVGCVAASDFDTSAKTQAVVVDNRLAGNRLAGNRLAGNRLAGNRLAGNRLAGNRLALESSADDLLETADGREVLSYIVSCALPDGVTLVGTDSGGTEYEFFGEIGLAPAWQYRPLHERGKRWVSACLFARVNAHDVAVPISMRGPSHALQTTDDERAGWASEEGAFYGQYFLPVDQPIAWYACRGRDSGEAHLDERDCAIPDPADPTHTICGFNFVGDCGDFAPPPGPKACKRLSHRGYYVDCSETAQSDHHHHFDHGDWFDDDWDGDHDCGEHDHPYRQVITTFVQ